jgi:hypothetical protein
MRVLAAILLLVMLATAAGLPQALHEREHDNPARTLAGTAVSAKPAKGAPAHLQHTCVLCLQLHSPTAAPARAWLIDTGAWVRYVSMLADGQRSQTYAGHRSCRGPPGAVSC